MLDLENFALLQIPHDCSSQGIMYSAVAMLVSAGALAALGERRTAFVTGNKVWG